MLDFGPGTAATAALAGVAAAFLFCSRVRSAVSKGEISVDSSSSCSSMAIGSSGRADSGWGVALSTGRGIS